jgi:hypothetical protein
MNAPKRLIAIAVISAIGLAAAPALAQPTPPGPPSDTSADDHMMAMPPGPSTGPGDVTQAPGNADQLHQRFAAALANAAMEQRRVGAQAAYARVLRGIARRLHALDRNNDGQITEREFAAGWMEAFRQLDRNGDGVLSEADLRMLMARLGQAGNDRNGGGNQAGPNFGGPNFGGPNFGGPNFGGPNFGGPNFGGPNYGGPGQTMPHQLYRR